MLKYIRTTQTQHGLSVRATILKRNYATGQKPDAQQISRLNVRRHRTLPAWNYTVAPQQKM